MKIVFKRERNFDVPVHIEHLFLDPDMVISKDIMSEVERLVKKIELESQKKKVEVDKKLFKKAKWINWAFKEKVLVNSISCSQIIHALCKKYELLQEINPNLDDLFHILNIKIVEKNQGVIECREVLTSNVENDFLEKLQKGEYLTVDQKLHYLKDPSLLKYDLYLQKEKILIDAKADQVSDFIENLLREYKKTI